MIVAELASTGVDFVPLLELIFFKFDIILVFYNKNGQKSIMYSMFQRSFTYEVKNVYLL